MSEIDAEVRYLIDDSLSLGVSGFTWTHCLFFFKKNIVKALEIGYLEFEGLYSTLAVFCMICR